MAILTQKTTKRNGQKGELWKLKNETAKRLQGRIKQVLESAKVKGWRCGENPARWEGHLEHQLASPGKIQKTTRKHHRSLHYSKIAFFMQKLREEQKNIFSAYAYALEFLILTAARSNEVRSATWDEIDLEKRIWSIPAEKMKTYKRHRVPLSTRVIQLLCGLPRTGTINLLFPSPLVRKKMPDNIFRTLIGKMGYGEEATAHGFRSTFRKWGIEKTQYPWEAQEYALAHKENNEVVAAYTRTDLFESRINLMQDWADFCDHI
jgi:integrase